MSIYPPCPRNQQTHEFQYYLHEIEKFRETVFSCASGAQEEVFDQVLYKRSQKSLNTVPLTIF